jgi:hypothetical protein
LINRCLQHRLFAEDLTAEYHVKTEGRGRNVDEWKQRAELVADGRTTAAAVPLQHGLHLLPDDRVDDGGVFAVVDLVLVARLADVGDVGE